MALGKHLMGASLIYVKCAEDDVSLNLFYLDYLEDFTYKSIVSSLQK